MSLIVALDLGFGNVKGAADNGKFIVLPSRVAIPADRVGLAGIGMRTPRKATRVAFEQYEFYVGGSAENRGWVVENLDFSRLASPELKALFYAAISELIPLGAEVRLVLGLPVPLLMDEVMARSTLEALKAQLAREHAARIDGREIAFRVIAIRAAAQPVGAWADWALNEEGRPAGPAARLALVGVIDIGLNTLDLYGVRGGQLEYRLVGGDQLGVRRLLDLIDRRRNYYELDNQVRAGRIPSEAMATWMSELLGAVNRAWRDVRPDLVLLVGGGALLLQDRVDAFRKATKAEVRIPDEPVLVNARGLLKWGRAVKW